MTADPLDHQPYGSFYTEGNASSMAVLRGQPMSRKCCDPVISSSQPVTSSPAPLGLFLLGRPMCRLPHPPMPSQRSSFTCASPTSITSLGLQLSLLASFLLLTTPSGLPSPYVNLSSQPASSSGYTYLSLSLLCLEGTVSILPHSLLNSW